MDSNDHYLYEWFRLTNMNVLKVYSLGLGLGIFFNSKSYLLVFMIETSNELIRYGIFYSFQPTCMDRNGHYLYEWFHLTNMNVLEVYSLGLGLGIFFNSKSYLLVFMIETSNELIRCGIFIHFNPPVWIEMAITYMSGST